MVGKFRSKVGEAIGGIVVIVFAIWALNSCEDKKSPDTEIVQLNEVKSESSICAEDNFICVRDRNVSSAATPCRSMIRKELSEFEPKFDGTFGELFTSATAKRDIQGKITHVNYSGDRVVITEANGSKSRVTYTCVYDIKSHTVADLSFIR